MSQIVVYVKQKAVEELSQRISFLKQCINAPHYEKDADSDKHAIKWH